MKSTKYPKKLIFIFIIALVFMQYIALPQYATSEEGEFTKDEFPYNVEFKQISLGKNHTGAIDSDGNLWMWGWNYYGQLGNGTTTNSSEPIKIKDGTKFNKISVGSFYTGAIDTDGNLWIWGRNKYGELGNGTTTNSSEPIKIKEGTKFKEISLKENHTGAIDEDGNIWTWGRNKYGELGNGTTTISLEPIKINNDETKFKEISLGYEHTAAIDTEGKLWMWGSNSYGRLGNGTTTNSSEPIKIKEATNFKQISLGYYHTGAIDENGNLWMWGINTYGQIGNETTTSVSTPTKISTGQITSKKPIEKKSNIKFKDVDLGENHTGAIDEEGNLWMWGYNYEGQIGNGTTNHDINIPTLIKEGSMFEKIRLGNNYTGTLDQKGNLWMWGSNSYNQLGNEDIAETLSPVRITKITNLEDDEPDPDTSYTLTINPGNRTYSQQKGTSRSVTAENLSVTFNYNYEGKNNETQISNFYRWVLTGGGSINDINANTTIYTYGKEDGILTATYNSIVLPVAQRDGYVFWGWYKDSDCTEENRINGTTFVPTSNITLYAKWSEAIEIFHLSSDTYKLEINDPIEDEKTGRVIEQKSYMYRINPNTTLTELLENLNTNGEVTVYNKAGNALRPNDIVGTGMTLVDIGEDKTVALILSVKGDPSGDGVITATDLAVMKQQILKELDLKGERFLSLDISDDGEITATDLAAIKQVLIKELDLSTIE